MVSMGSVRMRIQPLTHDQRAFGFDRRVIQLNYELLGSEYPGPHLVSRAVHSVVHPFKEAVRTVFVGAKSLVHRSSCSRGEGEASTSEERSISTVEKALMSIGGNWNARLAVQKVNIGEVMRDVRRWTDGE